MVRRWLAKLDSNLDTLRAFTLGEYEPFFEKKRTFLKERLYVFQIALKCLVISSWAGYKMKNTLITQS